MTKTYIIAYKYPNEDNGLKCLGVEYKGESSKIFSNILINLLNSCAIIINRNGLHSYLSMEYGGNFDADMYNKIIKYLNDGYLIIFKDASPCIAYAVEKLNDIVDNFVIIERIGWQ